MRKTFISVVSGLMLFLVSILVMTFKDDEYHDLEVARTDIYDNQTPIPSDSDKSDVVKLASEEAEN